MFRFAHPYFLYLLLLIPLLIALYLYGAYKQRMRLSKYGNLELLKQLMPNSSTVRPAVKFGLMLIGLVLIIFALARPQIGAKLETVKTEGIEAMLVLDVSNSMLAQDIQPSRLEYAKMMLSRLIDQMSNDKIGLIVFAGDAYVQMPISSDNVSAKMFLNVISPASVPRPGTALGTAIDLAIRSFGTNTSDAGRTIILLTDGENHEDDAVQAAKMAQERGITVHVVGLGRPEGTPIPMGGTMSFWKDKDGEVVVTKLDEQMCQQIAAAGKGIYVRADNAGTAMRTLSKEIDQMQKGEIETQNYSEYNEKFHILAWIALFLIVVEFFIYNRKNKQLNKIKLFERGKG